MVNVVDGYLSPPPTPTPKLLSDYRGGIQLMASK